MLASLVALGALVLAAAAWAAAGQLDTSFSNDGKRTLGFGNGDLPDEVRTVAVLANGGILAAGYSNEGTTTGYDYGFARFRPGGGLDTSFSGDGRRVVSFNNGFQEDIADGLAVLGDGRIVAAGHSATDADTQMSAARLMPNGQLDSSFSNDGRRRFSFGPGFSDSAEDLAVQSNGKLVLAGSSYGGSGVGRRIAVARLNRDGSLDQSFSNDGMRLIGFLNGAQPEEAAGVAIRPDGKIVLAGWASPADPMSADTSFALVRLNPDGSLDSSFSGDGRRLVNFGPSVDQAWDLAIRSDGKLVVAGSALVSGTGVDFAVARLHPSGAPDTSFSGNGRRTDSFNNAAGQDVAQAVALQGSKIVVLGDSDRNLGPTFENDLAMARYDAGGGLDTTFSGDGKRLVAFGNGDDRGEAVAIRAGRIVAAGSADLDPATGQNLDFAVARLLGS